MQIFGNKIFENPIKIIQAFDNKSFVEAFSQIETLRKRPNHYLLGYIRYEAKDIFLGKKIKSDFPLLYFELYCHCEERSDEETVGQDCYPVVCSTIDFKTYSKAIKRIKEEIANGNTYEVNYTYDYKIETDLDGIEFYKAILPRQTTPYNAYIKNEFEEILSFSPELFFEIERNKIKTKPMKGTKQRGSTKEEDKENIEFLKNDIKNQVENVMIVDLLRNDLGKIAKTGTVKVDKMFEIETHKTLHQMTSEISAELDENITLYEIFNAIYPCGSITGTPKINTMEIIEHIEGRPRGVYCGAIGLITNEKIVFSVPIRTLQKKNNARFLTCGVGGAIVWDSKTEEEWEETKTKIKFLQSSLRHCEEQSDEAIQKNLLFGLPRRDFIPPRNDVNYKLVETILVKNGKLQFEKEHFKRLEKSAKELVFKFSKQQIANGKWQNDCILRVLLNKQGVFETQELPLESIKTNKVIISKMLIDSKEPLLYHKTTHRPWYEEAMEKIKQGIIFDEIFFNEKGELTEGARSNIILQIDGKLLTPPVECGLLNGILRQELLKSTALLLLTPALSRKGRGRLPNTLIIEKKLYLKDLQKAEKIFCINSVRGIVEVEIINKK